MSTASDPPVCPNLRISAAKATPYTHEAYQALMREISLPSRFGLTELRAFCSWRTAHVAARAVVRAGQVRPAPSMQLQDSAPVGWIGPGIGIPVGTDVISDSTKVLNWLLCAPDLSVLLGCSVVRLQ